VLGLDIVTPSVRSTRFDTNAVSFYLEFPEHFIKPTTRLRSRPRNRWQDEVREDGRLVGGKGWKERVYNSGLSTPSFGREVKPWVPCRRFAACKRSLDVPWKSASRQN
jgi:hypothetical protein